MSLDEADVASGRERWKFYTARGYEIRSFNLARASVAVPTARELLEQADALMRRNRAALTADAEIPELTDIVAMVASAPAARPPRRPRTVPPPAVLDDVPELTEAVEEIEIESIVELPEDLDESSGWLPSTTMASSASSGPRSGHGRSEQPPIRSVPPGAAVASTEPPALARSRRSRRAAVDAGPRPAPTRGGVTESHAAARRGHRRGRFGRDRASRRRCAARRTQPATPASRRRPPTGPLRATTDEWARWEALADEIRMQVLQRIDIFTDTGCATS